jgi:hypothetical protein
VETNKKLQSLTKNKKRMKVVGMELDTKSEKKTLSMRKEHYKRNNKNASSFIMMESCVNS